MKYYTVDELDNDRMCFTSISEIKEAAEELGLDFESLNIYDTKMIKMQMDAVSILEREIENSDFINFDLDYVPDEKINELQELLNGWCDTLDTNNYEKDNLLTIEEVREILDKEL